MHVERSNLTLRMHSRRFTRLTNAFSKKVEFHRYAVALHFMYYTFCKPHMTLTKERGGIKTTPAKAAGLTDRVWKIEELLPPNFVSFKLTHYPNPLALVLGRRYSSCSWDRGLVG